MLVPASFLRQSLGKCHIKTGLVWPGSAWFCVYVRVCTYECRHVEGKMARGPAATQYIHYLSENNGHTVLQQGPLLLNTFRMVLGFYPQEKTINNL